MARSGESFYIELLNGLRTGEEFKRYLTQIYAALDDPQAAAVFIGCNIFGVFKHEGIAKQVKEFIEDVLSVKIMLCRSRPYARHIALELEEMRDSANYLLVNIQSQADYNGVYLPLSEPESEFRILSEKAAKLIGYHMLILYELGQGSAEVVSILYKYNFVQKLLFVIEKGPQVIIGEKTLKKISQQLLILIFSYIEIANSFCVKLDLFKWLLRVSKSDLFKARDTEMIEALSYLSFSDAFLPKTEEELIINDWVYKGLVMILIPEKRDQYFLSVNKGVTEVSFMKLLSLLSQILGNISRSQGGIEEIISSIESFSVDVVWRVHYSLIKFAVKDFSVWFTVLYLTNNILRYPYYNPPIYASSIAVMSFNLTSNINDVLLTIACRAFRYLEFSTEDKAELCKICTARVRSKSHSVPLSKLPPVEALDDSSSIMRNVPKITKEWNQYFENKKKPWESIYSPVHTPENYTDPIQKYLLRLTEQFSQFKLFFKKLPKPCEFCQDFYGPPFFPDDMFWKLYSPLSELKAEDIDEHTAIVLIQFISVLCEEEQLSFIMNNVMPYLNELLVIGEGVVEERVKCAIITLYVSWSELRNGFIHFYLATGLMLYHQYYNSLTLQALDADVSPVQCKWNSTANTFKLEKGKNSSTDQDVGHWRIHMLFHLLELLSTILRVAPRSVRTGIKSQCIGLVDSNYLVVMSLYQYIENKPQVRALINSVISTTEEVSYVLIRTIPGLFYVIADTIFNRENMVKVFIDITGFLPSLLTLYTHTSSYYLFLSKDKTKKMVNQVLELYLENFAQSTLKVLGNLNSIIDDIEASNRPKPTDIQAQISEKLEKILIVKCTYYTLLSLLHSFEASPSKVEQIPSLTYTRMYDRLVKITSFAERHFKNKSVDDKNFELPMSFRNSHLKLIPGSKNYIVLDFEDENEDKLFRVYLTTILTWVWSLSQTDSICTEFVLHKYTREIFRMCFEYEYWTIHSYMAMCSVIYNFTIMKTLTVLNCLPLTIPIIVKLISEMNVPIEGYLLLFQSVREIYPKLILPSAIQQIQQIIAPLRTILSSTNPVLKYYNYPLLKKVKDYSDPNTWVLEDETQMAEVFPKQLLNTLPVDKTNKYEEYPGQALLQSEAKSIIKMITPVTREGVETTRNKNKLHVKAGQGHLLYYRPEQKSRDRQASMFHRIGSRVIGSQISMVDPDMLMDPQIGAKVNSGYSRLISELFDKQNQYED